jgi:hypothetical protein
VKLPEQRRQVGLDDVPNNLKIDVAVVVHNAIPHPDDFGERDVRKFGAFLCSEPGCRFPSYEEPSEDRVLRLVSPKN